MDINLYQIDPGFDARTLFTPMLIKDELAEILPLNTVSTELSETPFQAMGPVMTSFWFFQPP